jgi:hypothetical protein
VELAEQRKRPFSSNSVPVRLVYDPNVPNGLAAVCEKSAFSAKNTVVFELGKNGELLHQTVAFADASMTFPCPGDGETVRLNYKEILELTKQRPSNGQAQPLIRVVHNFNKE